jgi:ABC-2 type transport system permease protein
LFRYGARINPVIVQDLECGDIMLSIRSGNSQQQYLPAPWLYYPLLIPSLNHSISRNLNRVKGEFTNYIDTVGLDPAIRKEILLATSNYSRILYPPLVITLKEAEIAAVENEFNRPNLPVALLLEGIFPSAFLNRAISSLTDDKNYKLKTESIQTKMIVIADADIIRNEVRRVGMEETPLTLGQDKYTGQMFGNRDFLVNCLNYLVDDHGIMELRSRELKLRLLDNEKVKTEKLKWQLINIAGPIMIVLIAGFMYNYFRRRNYTRY